jgi:hypothetical protein
MGDAARRERVLDPSPRSQRAIAAGGALLPAGLVAWQVPQILLVPFDLDPWVRIPITLLAAVALLVAVLLVHAAMRPTPRADPERGVLIVGRHRIPYDEITEAKRVIGGTWRQDTVAISFGPSTTLRATVVLRRRDRIVPSAAQRELLIDLLERSSIRVPASPWDPEAKFTRVNFPGALDIASAVALVRDPPPAAGPFPEP